MIDYRDPTYAFVWVLPALFPVSAGIVYHLPPYITWVPFLIAVLFAILFPKIQTGHQSSSFGRVILAGLTIGTFVGVFLFSIRSYLFSNRVQTLIVVIGLLLCGISARLYYYTQIQTASSVHPYLPIIFLGVGEVTYVSAWFVLTWYLSPHLPASDGSILVDWIQTPFFWLYWILLQGSISMQLIQSVSPESSKGRRFLRRGVLFTTILLIPGGVLLLFLTHAPIQWLVYGVLWMYTWKTDEQIIRFFKHVEENRTAYTGDAWLDLKNRWVRQSLYYMLFALLFCISYAVTIRTL